MGREGGSSSLERAPLAETLLEVAINLIADSRAGSPQAKKLLGKEHNLIQKQVTGLKLY